MTPSNTQKLLLQVAGGGLALFGVAFVIIRMEAYSSELALITLSSSSWVGIAILTLVYCAANGLLVVTWRSLLMHLQQPITFATAIRVFGISQLAKYIPGNVAQFAGRQVLGMSNNLRPGVLAKSLVWEISVLTIAAAQFSWLAASAFLPNISHAYSLGFFCASIILTSGFCWIIFGRQVTLSLISAILFFFTVAAIFSATVFIVYGGGDLPPLAWLAIGGGYIAAWFVGFITPGAPAGIGIRELVLLYLTAGLVPESDLLVIVVLCRITSVSADLLFFLTSIALSKRG